MESIYQRIEALIAERGMTKKAFCQQLGISTGNFGDWKRGKTTPGTNKLIEIATFFDISLDWLMIGRIPGNELVNEKQGTYFFDDSGQLNCQLDQLTDQEKEFIKDYIEFSTYRKKHKKK